MKRDKKRVNKSSVIALTICWHGETQDVSLRRWRMPRTHAAAWGSYIRMSWPQRSLFSAFQCHLQFFAAPKQKEAVSFCQRWRKFQNFHSRWLARRPLNLEPCFAVKKSIVPAASDLNCGPTLPGMFLLWNLKVGTREKVARSPRGARFCDGFWAFLLFFQA